MIYATFSNNNITYSYQELERDLNTYLKRANNNTTDGKRDKS